MTRPAWRPLEELDIGPGRIWTRENLFRCDPYLVWADATTTPDAGTELNIAVLVELSSADGYAAFWDRMNPTAPDGTVQRRFFPNGFEPAAPSRFITGLVNRDGLVALIDQVVQRLIERFSLQESRHDIAETVSIEWERADPERRRLASATTTERSCEATGAGAYLGVIDDGLPVLRIRDAIQLADQPAHFWDQGWQPPHLGDTQVKPQDPPADDEFWRAGWDMDPLFLWPWLLFPSFRGFLYGRRLKSFSPTGAGASNDRDEYFLSRYYTPAPRQTHGASVLGLLAPWLSGARGPVEWPKHISGLAMVQLPTGTVMDTSGGSLAMRVIDGLRYILWQEEHDRPEPRKCRPIVANVSYGTHAGPHDGTSMFERALAEMLDAYTRLHVVLPVGNAARAGCHARLELAPNGQPQAAASLALQVCPDNGRDTFVEIWVPCGAQIELSIRPPGSAETYEIGEGQAKICFDADPRHPDRPARVRFGAVYSAEVAQGTKGAMVLLAIGPTRVLRHHGAQQRGLNQQRRRQVRSGSGIWELTVRNLTSRASAVDAWVERDDAPPDVPRGSRQAYFPDSCCEQVRLHNATPEDTLNGIATLKHDRLHVVGAMRADGMLSDYSAAGRGRPPASREGPDVVTVADASRNVPGLRTMGFVRGAIGRINGTSAACAVYARALASELGNGPTQPPSVPGDPPPEMSCVTDSQPQADPSLRGQGVRRILEVDVPL